ncbi:hypothetical protein A2671_00935 [Candidatus Kaiserbacteria bacterium RIFCSPHIGHO2_01_FULL_49_13]|uniref:ATP-cone domain-containing protein n=1 Tax=Candidatus Kaiserbacteria bacterium RIFCSPHIGHO2_01_FULL_49_13 TaxID=1798477 RepID=A0A1F6CF12_9BACT|nr:MAG: hypothetical protein A2671_00935 [Candidatus Kaiserbacteria bacterium RIFCSPHIGHO2_01_FULL_49_13]
MTEIVKDDGTRELFNPEKLRSSLKRAGASRAAQEEIISHIHNELTDGMTTGRIYRHAFTLLRKTSRPTAARYSMRRAILDLGPSGFPFETFVGEIFKARGYSVLNDQMIQGACVEHEVDLVAQKPFDSAQGKESECIVAEIKFHNSLSIKSDVQVALYVRARFLDLEQGRKAPNNTFCMDRGMLITNTKFTHQAIRYGSCAGLSMVGWNYPQEGNLHDLIEETKMHPITALTSLTRREKNLLLERRIVLSKSLLEKHDSLTAIGILSSKAEAVLTEASALSQSSI